MLNLQDKVAPNTEVVVTELDGEAVLLHLNTKMYYSLNPTGLCIWNMLADDTTLSEIGGRLQNRYELDTKNAEQSVLNLVNQLHSEQLVTRVGV